MKTDTIKKLYYSISEVSEITGLKAHVLRYWETEFEQLRPKKNRAGNRTYTARDIEIVERIQHLLRDEKYTIEGARQALARGAPAPGAASHEELAELRAFLEDVLNRLP
ncbi:MAG: MerR family transcriptional regulator [Rhodothermaceae bacterium]|nr:MerR family transcriptional regulator [Rhodothermaceae bacterium]